MRVDAEPFVRMVVVSYGDPRPTLRCLDHLDALDWPAHRREVVVVDNGPGDGLARLLVPPGRAGTRLLRSPANLGFGGGCNLALADLSGVDYVALVNNDAFVEPGWLRPLVAALDADPGLGAANGKVVFAPVFADVVVESPAFRPPRPDRRRLGVQVSG
ncbi:MAG: glycosyltransferase, partial [Acidimicrobiales bacterium]